MKRHRLTRLAELFDTTPEEILLTRRMMVLFHADYPEMAEGIVEMLPLAAREADQGIEGPGTAWCDQFKALYDEEEYRNRALAAVRCSRGRK